jgi:hypothetical protein
MKLRKENIPPGTQLVYLQTRSGDHLLYISHKGRRMKMGALTLAGCKNVPFFDRDDNTVYAPNGTAYSLPVKAAE